MTRLVIVLLCHDWKRAGGKPGEDTNIEDAEIFARGETVCVDAAVACKADQQ